LDKDTPPIVELPADRVVLLRITPPIELLTAVGVVMVPVVANEIFVENMFELVSVHPPILLVVRLAFEILPEDRRTFPTQLDPVPVEIFPVR
jgi:hypothetical protein